MRKRVRGRGEGDGKMKGKEMVREEEGGGTLYIKIPRSTRLNVTPSPTPSLPSPLSPPSPGSESRRALGTTGWEW